MISSEKEEQLDFMSEGNKTFRLERRFEKAYDTADLLVPISPIKKDTLFPYTEM